MPLRLLWCFIQLILSTFCTLIIHFPKFHDKLSLLRVRHSDCLVFGFLCMCLCLLYRDYQFNISVWV